MLDVNEEVIESQGRALIDGSRETLWAWVVAGVFIGLAIGLFLADIFWPDSLAYRGTTAWVAGLVGGFIGWLGGRDRAAARNAQGQVMLLLVDLHRASERAEPSPDAKTDATT